MLISIEFQSYLTSKCRRVVLLVFGLAEYLFEDIDFFVVVVI
jgi:hypothetical protein